jgi:hypothetical protein
MAQAKKAGSKVLTRQQHDKLKKAFLAVLASKQSFDAKVKQLDATVTALSIRK